jgi:stage V sporulation protein B
MKRAQTLFSQMLMLAASSLALRGMGLGLQVYLSARIGAAGVGLLQLIMSVYFLAVTLSAAGLRLAATRLVAEELATGRGAGVRRATGLCLVYGLMLSLAAAAALFFGGTWLGTHWLADARAVPALRLAALGLPFISMSSVLGGYFTAVRRASRAALVQLADEGVKIWLTLRLLPLALPMGLQHSCAAVVGAGVAGDFCCFCILFFCYRLDVKKRRGGAPSPVWELRKRLLSITLPLSLSACATSGLRTLQQMMIPAGLRKGGASSEGALTALGAVQGMAMPLIFFPAVLLHAAAELILPELAECRAQGNDRRFDYIVNRMLRLVLLYAAAVSGLFLCFSGSLCQILYKSGQAAPILTLLAPLTPVIYLDALVDSMLKGTGEQTRVMGYNILESAIGIGLVALLLPRLGIAGYFITIYVSRTLNFALGVHRLAGISKLELRFGLIFKTLACSLAAPAAARLIMDTGFAGPVSAPRLAMSAGLALALFAALALLTGCLGQEDARWLHSLWSIPRRKRRAAALRPHYNRSVQ